MLVPTIVLGVIAVVCIVLGYQKGGAIPMLGLKTAGTMLIQLVPLLIFAFIIAGMLPLLIPKEMISTWVGPESGFRGILIGTLVGGILPGGPYTSLPIVAGLLRVGANVGTMVALLTAWSLLAFTRLPLDIAILGWKFTLMRLACTFFFPPIAGIIASKLFPNVSLF